MKALSQLFSATLLALSVAPFAQAKSLHSVVLVHDAFADMAKKIHAHVSEVTASHVSMLSQPDSVVRVITAAVNAH
jgi:putative cell wall-binding protein